MSVGFECWVNFDFFDLVIFVQWVGDLDLFVVIFYVVGDFEWCYCQNDVGFIDLLV